MISFKESENTKSTVRTFLSAFGAVMGIIFLILVFAGCGDRQTVDLTYRRAAVLHADGEVGAIEHIENDAEEELKLHAAQAFIYDADLGKYLYLRGSDKILYPASTTKLLTALYALELLSPEELITPGEELTFKNEQSAIAFIKEHHTLSVEMLIEGMMLPSGGDAAYALAAAGGYALSKADISASEAVDLFIQGMNEYAKEIGMCGSNFTSPDGFHDPENYSTLEDMTILALAASKNEIIMKYASLPSASVTYASGHTNTWRNTNRMLHEEDEYYSPYVTGLKTGTLEGNSCLICTFSINGKNYIAGVFSEKTEELRYIDMKDIIAFCEDRESSDRQ
ncbi:MAG: D-alanyl-D-alanine carboxypeptidase [Clostridia bacterium]|nr:D-alanyl-D-alanine carboxypeptidase [Clostridia bacterium]